MHINGWYHESFSKTGGKLILIHLAPCISTSAKTSHTISVPISVLLYVHCDTKNSNDPSSNFTYQSTQIDEGWH